MVADTYRVEVRAYNPDTGEYDVFYTRDGLRASDFPHDIVNGVSSSTRYATTMEAVFNNDTRRSIAFDETAAQPVCKIC